MSRTIDFIGQRFGNLIIVERVPKPENLKTKGTYWRCECDCGNKNFITNSHLLHKGHTTSCGHCNSFISLIGKKFGKLIVIEKFDKKTKNNGEYWKCVCDCDGKEVIVDGKNLRSGHTKSCGCERNSPETLKKRGLSRRGGIKTFENSKYLTYKAGAEKRGIPFNLTKEEIDYIEKTIK